MSLKLNIIQELIPQCQFEKATFQQPFHVFTHLSKELRIHQYRISHCTEYSYRATDFNKDSIHTGIIANNSDLELLALWLGGSDIETLP